MLYEKIGLFYRTISLIMLGYSSIEDWIFFNFMFRLNVPGYVFWGLIFVGVYCDAIFIYDRKKGKKFKDSPKFLQRFAIIDIIVLGLWLIYLSSPVIRNSLNLMTYIIIGAVLTLICLIEIIVYLIYIHRDKEVAKT